MKSKLILHAIVCYKPHYKTKEQAIEYARSHFSNENIKGFVRETDFTFRIRVYPKTMFNKTSFVSKVILLP